MGNRCRFVQPEVVRLPLSDGDFLDVKKSLTAGETRQVFTNLVKTMHAGEPTDLDPDQVGKTKIMAYVIAWSLVDAQGSPVPFSEAALDNLEPATYAEIVQAIDAHEALQEAARTHPELATGSKATSESVA